MTTQENAEQGAPEQEAPRRPGRPKKSEATTTERRRRKGGSTHKLAIPDAVKKAHPNMEFRWGRDTDARIQKLTQDDDWDKVPGQKPIHGGTDAGGNGFKMHLLMKPSAFWQDDQQEKLDALKAKDQEALSRPDAKTATETGAGMYSVPGNKI